VKQLLVVPEMEPQFLSGSALNIDGISTELFRHLTCGTNISIPTWQTCFLDKFRRPPPCSYAHYSFASLYWI